MIKYILAKQFDPYDLLIFMFACAVWHDKGVIMAAAIFFVIQLLRMLIYWTNID